MVPVVKCLMHQNLHELPLRQNLFLFFCKWTSMRTPETSKLSRYILDVVKNRSCPLTAFHWSKQKCLKFEYTCKCMRFGSNTLIYAKT